METVTIDLPKMYGDHHVTDVRRILLATPGVEDVYASSAFRVARARIDPAKVSEADLRARLAEAGYLGDLPIEAEAWKTGTPAEVVDNPFRHTAALENIKGVAFGQRVEETAGQALWPCPGMGPIQKMDE
jgi:copper chaperone CopZ